MGSAPGFAGAAGSTASNIAFFGGSWFFTAAALLQFRLSGHLGAASAITGSLKVGREVHVSEWLSGLIQFFGTIAFNISTGTALIVHSIVDQDR